MPKPKPRPKRALFKPTITPITEDSFGRPLKYSVDDIKLAAIQYFEECLQNRWIPSKAGLLRKLNMSRESYREYKKKKDFVDTIRFVEHSIEEAWVQRLTSQGANGAIFYLKNAFRDDYQDRVENDITSRGEKLSALAVIQSETRKILEGDKPEKK